MNLNDINEPPTLAEVLTQVETFVRRFCALPSEHATTAVVLWVAHTHAMKAWDSTPRLAALSPEPGSGKTRLAIEVVGALVPNPMDAVNCTPAALFRKLAEDPPPTVLHDECDTIWGTRKQAEQNEDVRGLINAGHRRSGKAWRCVGQGTQQQVGEFPAYAAVALAGLGRLPDTILSRSIVIRMRRRGPNERVEPWRSRDCEPQGHALRDLLVTSLVGRVDHLSTARPDMPADVTDRDADKWEPLLAVADLAGEGWPFRARAAAQWFVQEATAAESASLGIRLLADLRAIWIQHGDPAGLPTTTLLDDLHDLEEAPWADLYGHQLDARRLARYLRDYGVTPQTVRVGKSTPKGYRRDDLWDPWQRYLPSTSDSRHIRNTRNIPSESVADVAYSPSDVASARGAAEHEVSDVADVSATPR